MHLFIYVQCTGQNITREASSSWYVRASRLITALTNKIRMIQEHRCVIWKRLLLISCLSSLRFHRGAHLFVDTFSEEPSTNMLQQSRICQNNWLRYWKRIWDRKQVILHRSSVQRQAFCDSIDTLHVRCLLRSSDRYPTPTVTSSQSCTKIRLGACN